MYFEVLPNQKIHTMSGGQKCRLCLACAMYRKPHLLVLDERKFNFIFYVVLIFVEASLGLNPSHCIPIIIATNHLDTETSDALIEAIQSFQGGVILVSHDQHLLSKVCKELYVVGNGTVERLDFLDAPAAFQAYKKDVLAGRR
jgi:ATP-binding cassette, subfamily F, member 3